MKLHESIIGRGCQSPPKPHFFHDQRAGSARSPLLVHLMLQALRLAQVLPQGGEVLVGERDDFRVHVLVVRVVLQRVDDVLVELRDAVDVVPLVVAGALLPLTRRREVVYLAHNVESAFRGQGPGLARFERAVLRACSESWMATRVDQRGAARGFVREAAFDSLSLATTIEDSFARFGAIR